jgi:phage-related protein
LVKNPQLTQRFKVLFLQEAADFLDGLDPKSREKIIFNIRKAQVSNDHELFKKLNDEIWEFRTLFKKTKYRLFAFWDKRQKPDTVVITTHGIIKKTDKIPLADLNKAENIRKKYFGQKSEKNER